MESKNNITFDCKYHVVFYPKYCRKVLINGVDARLKELLNRKAQELRTDIVQMAVMPDHVARAGRFEDWSENQPQT